jgi:cytidylate kinase
MTGNIISLTGVSCSGKTTAGRLFADSQGYQFHSMGEYYREHLQGMPLCQVDNVLEMHIYDLMSPRDDIVVEGRTTGIIIGDYRDKNTLSLFLDVSLDRQVERYLYRSGLTDEQVARAELIAKDAHDQERLLAKYEIDIFDRDNYDHVIDTSEITVDEVVGQIEHYWRLRCQI